MKALSRKGKAAPTGKVSAALSPQAQQLKVAKPTAEHEIVQQLQRVLARIDHLPLPTGQLGCEFLDALKLTERISEKVFAKARELLKENPTAIPNWRVDEIPRRRISKDAAAVFDALSFHEIPLEEFVRSCTISIAGVRKLLTEKCPEFGPAEIEYMISRHLKEVIHHELVARLTRSKERKRPGELRTPGRNNL